MSSFVGNIKILFVYWTLSSFVARDLEILQRHFNVRKLKNATFLVFRSGRDPFAHFKLVKEIGSADIVYAWWADLNAFFIVLFCMLLRKKSIIVVGGREVAYVPEISYGNLLSRLGRLEVGFILRHASKVLAVSKSSEREILQIARPKNLRLVYNCVDTNRFKPNGLKEDLVLTVSAISEETTRTKGLQTFVQASTYLSDLKFVVFGPFSDNSIERLKKACGSNMMFTGGLSNDTLLRYYQKAKVYCQLSTHESFGVALAEAMSCGCVPVVTRSYALPEVVGDAGFYVPNNDPIATAEAIKKAMKSSKGREARERVERNFSLEIREKLLVKEISALARNG